LWCTHCETSSGVLNDLGSLKALCAEFQVKLCLDAISSIGTVPVDLSGVHLASCSSGKGLRAYPGISMVFYDFDFAEATESTQCEEGLMNGASRASGRPGPKPPPKSTPFDPVRPHRNAPRYLDLRYYASQDGVAFTFPSNLLHALQAAMKRA